MAEAERGLFLGGMAVCGLPWQPTGLLSAGEGAALKGYSPWQQGIGVPRFSWAERATKQAVKSPSLAVLPTSVIVGAAHAFAFYSHVGLDVRAHLRPTCFTASIGTLTITHIS